MFSVHITPKDLTNAAESPVIFDFLFDENSGRETTRLLRWRHRNVFENLRFQNFFRSEQNAKPAFSNSSRLKWFSFRDGLVWTVGLTVEIKLRFRDGVVWTVGLAVEIKLRFYDGLVWTVGLTVEIKLRFRDGLVWTV